MIALALILGAVGAQRWYLGDTKTGWIFIGLFVGGLIFGLPLLVAVVWAVVDAINSRALTDEANSRIWSEISLQMAPPGELPGPYGGTR